MDIKIIRISFSGFSVRKGFCKVTIWYELFRLDLPRKYKKISFQAWEKINRIMIKYAAKNGFEKGRTVRVDSTVVETNILRPTDSSLIYDCIRVISRNVFQLNGLNKNNQLQIPKLKFSCKLTKKSFFQS